MAAVKKTVWFGSNKFKNIVFENNKIFWIPKLWVKVVPFNDRRLKERILIKVVPDIKRSCITRISSKKWKRFFGVALRDIVDFCFFKFYKTFLIIYTNIVIGVTLNLVLGITLLSMCLVWLQLWPTRHYTEWIAAFGKKTYYTLGHKGYHHNQYGVW